MKALLTDWSFWAVVVAAVAVLLSQLPPIKEWFAKAHVSVEVHSRIVLTHHTGNPNAQVHLILSNDGVRSLRIKNIELEFIRDRQHRFTLPVQTYFYEPGDIEPVLFTPTPLYPDEDWSHSGNYFNYYDRTDERRFRDAESNLRQNIVGKQGLAPGNELIEADQGLVAPLIDFFNEKFDWLPGEYEMKVVVTTDQVTTSRKYLFTVFESESNELKSATENYKYGAWIYWTPEGVRHPAITIQLNEVDA